MVTDTPLSVDSSAVNPSSAVHAVHRAVGVGALGDVGAQAARSASTRSPKVQRRKSIDVGAPRADPAAAALAVEQPAVGTQRDAEAGAEHGPLDVLDRADRAVLEQGAQRDATGVVAELEVEERDGAGVARCLLHRLGVGGRRAERFVAEHRLAGVERAS